MNSYQDNADHTIIMAARRRASRLAREVQEQSEMVDLDPLVVVAGKIHAQSTATARLLKHPVGSKKLGVGALTQAELQRSQVEFMALHQIASNLLHQRRAGR